MTKLTSIWRRLRSRIVSYLYRTDYVESIRDLSIFSYLSHVVNSGHLYERPSQQRLSLSNAVTANSSQTRSGSSRHKSWVTESRPRVSRMSRLSADASASVDDCARCRSCRRPERCLTGSRWTRWSAVAALLHVSPADDSTQLWTCWQTTPALPSWDCEAVSDF